MALSRLGGDRLGGDRLRVWVALLAGLALTAIALAVTLSGAPSVVAATNGVPLEARLAKTAGSVEICQPDETLPRETSAIRLALEAAIGPQVRLDVYSGAHLITAGTRSSGWTAGSVTIPVGPLPYTTANATLCFTIGRSRVPVTAFGAPAPRAIAARYSEAQVLSGRVRSEYLRAGRASWWSQALSVARRMGLGRSLSGTWIALLVLVLVLGLSLLAAWLVVRELAPSARVERKRPGAGKPRASVLRRVPAAAWTCALVAGLNAVCWSLITPPFQVPDESAHFDYVQVLAQQQRLPGSTGRSNSAALQVTLADLQSLEIRFNPPHRSLASEAQQRKLERDQAADFSERAPGGAGSAGSEPPLYYALETIPYALASGGSLLDRLEAMRLLSAALAAITALFGYLFIREALPGARWAWTVGGLAVAVFPLLGFMSGGVNPDAMLFAICAALYYCLARAFRRGLTPRLAVATGTLTAAGLLTKLNFVGFAPGVLVAFALLWLHARRGVPEGPARHRAYRWPALALAIAASPVALYALAGLLSSRPALGNTSSTIDGLGGSWPEKLSYVWQFYLPRLPGMHSYFPSVLTTRQLWFDGWVGFYGWADTLFPGWVYDIALIPAAAIAALGIRELARRRGAVRRRLPELAVYALTGVGVTALVGLQSYESDVRQGFEPFWEPRYLLPMLALWGCLVALAARGAGRRWGPAVGALLVVMLLAHDVFSQLQVIARYYG